MDAVLEVANRQGIERIVACGPGEFVIRDIADQFGFEAVLVSKPEFYHRLIPVQN